MVYTVGYCKHKNMKSLRFVVGFASLWILLSVKKPSSACMEFKRGCPYQTLKLQILHTEDTCSCCGACHSSYNCASFSFFYGRCRLYSKVAGPNDYLTLNNCRYFVMPGKSKTSQFCRNNSDCVQSGNCSNSICAPIAGIDQEGK